MPVANIPKIKDRSQILSYAKEKLVEEKSKLEAELLELKKFKGLAKATLAEKLLDVQQQVGRLTELISLVDSVSQEKSAANLFVYQHSYGSPISISDPCYLGTDHSMWRGCRSIVYMPEFSEKSSGSEWSRYNERGEGSEYFRLLVRV